MFWKLLISQLAENKDVILKILLSNRHLKTKKDIDEYFNPPSPEKISLKDLGIKLPEVKRAVTRIKQAIKNKDSIIVYGDYDADGICGTAILWEALYKLGANVLPYIPSRVKEGYGLSEKGIDNISKQITNNIKQLIITVDHGIVANKQVEYAKKKGFEVIITDHHVPPKKLPKALAIIHTTKLSGSGVAWIVAREILESFPNCSIVKLLNCYLDLAAIGSIADLVPLTGANRTLVKSGLEKLNQTKRIGLLELIKDAGLKLDSLGTYEVGYLISPRLNAMGRLEHALDSLRLLCTTNKTRAEELAKKLGLKNKERRELTEKTTEHAKNFQFSIFNFQKKKLIFISHESYNQGVIGLVAGKLVEEFYRPAVVISKGEEISKGSARSINGFNIIEAIRKCSDLLVDCGGHPMAAGFTVENKYLDKLRRRLEKLARDLIPEEKLEKELKIDCQINLANLSFSLYNEIQKMQPFGIGNPGPVFLTNNLRITDLRLVGREQKHLKLKLDDFHTEKEEKIQATFEKSGISNFTLRASEASREVKFSTSAAYGGLRSNDNAGHISIVNGIGFNLALKAKDLKVGDLIDVVYTISLNEWNGSKKLELKIKDIKRTEP